LAYLYQMQGRLLEAELLYKRALELREKALPDGHPDIATSLNNLASLYLVQGRLTEAEILNKRALQLYEKALPAGHPHIAQSLNNLATLYQDQGRLAQAEDVYKGSLELREKTLPASHPDIAQSLNNLAFLYQAQGRLAQAESLYKRALAIDEAALPPDHPDLALYRSNLASLYVTQRRLAEAEPLRKSALAINEKVFGTKHPKVANSLAQLGDLYRLEGRCDEGQVLFDRARTIGPTGVKEVPLQFATNRLRDATAASPTFTGAPGKELAFGLVVVTVPSEQAVAATPRPSPDGSTTEITPTEPRRLAMNCSQIVPDRSIIDTSVGHVEAARLYPKQALVFVHGYNVSFDNALRRAGQIAYDIDFDGATFLFSWPSRGDLVGYWTDIASADRSIVDFENFVRRIVAKTKVEKVHFIAHSMGNRVMLQALRDLVDSDLAPLIGEVIDAAPDVSPKMFREAAARLNGKGKPVTLYASSGDVALRTSSLLRLEARVGYIFGDRPLISPGVDTIDISIAAEALGLNHDTYSASPLLMADIRRLIETGVHPPTKRSGMMVPVSSKEGIYWRLKQ
jgi:esterase/lipase superfamily enzyme/Flp pilus assembly protein TadD